MKKTAVLLYPQFSEYEISVALSILMQGRNPVVTIGVNGNPKKGESGLACVPDLIMDHINYNEFDSLLLPGCMDIMALNHVDRYVDFIKQMVNREAVIASISSSPFLLAKAGALAGRKYTAGLVKEFMKEAGIFELDLYSDDLVVQDDNIITARGRGFIKLGSVFGMALGLEFDERWYRE